MTGFDLAAIFLTLIGLVGWLNARFWRLPSATVMVAAGLVGAAGLLAAHSAWPGSVAGELVDAIAGIDFPKTVIGYMLAFLLFAGASQVDLQALRRERASVWSLATLGVLVSTVMVGCGFWGAARLLGIDLTLPWALVFGALISPTDPIAVLAAVRQGNLSKTLEVVLQGEALFNDGVGIVVFTALLAVATAGGQIDPAGAIGHVALEAIGGGVLGFVCGHLVIRAMARIDEYGVEVGLTLALAAGVYALAQALHLSGPIAVVVAGLLVGDRGAKSAMSEETQTYVRAFWTLVDEILNAVLFLLLGLQLVVVPLTGSLALLWLAAIGLVLAARIAVVLPWGAYFQRRHKERGASALLTWGGLHGALSLALALSVPEGPAREVILSATFAVVIASVLVQGLTFGPLAARLAGPAD